MSTGVFLVTSFVLICVIGTLEVRAFLSDPANLITYLSRKHVVLRLLIESVFILGAIWWPLHLASGQ